LLYFCLAGELLATYEDNAREFLFPTPRVSPSYPGVDREVLLRRSATFPGIAPKLEFSSRTVIKEVIFRYAGIIGKNIFTKFVTFRKGDLIECYGA